MVHRAFPADLFPPFRFSIYAYHQLVDGQTIIGQLTGEFVDGQTICQLTGEFVDGQTILLARRRRTPPLSPTQVV